MQTTFWEAVSQLSTLHFIGFLFALFVAFGFEFINGFHDTANAVAFLCSDEAIYLTGESMNVSGGEEMH